MVLEGLKKSRFLLCCLKVKRWHHTKWDFLFQPFKRKPFFVTLFHNEVFCLYCKTHNQKLKKEFRKDVSFPKLNKMVLLFPRRKEIGKFLPDPSTTTYYYTHSLFMCFTPSSHQSKSWSPNSWPKLFMSPKCCHFSSHRSFQISKQL